MTDPSDDDFYGISPLRSAMAGINAQIEAIETATLLDTADNSDVMIDTIGIDDITDVTVDPDTDLKTATGTGKADISIGHSVRRAERIESASEVSLCFEISTYQCATCDVRRPSYGASRGYGEDGLDTPLECYGECDGETDHEYVGPGWDPIRIDFECPECGYETVMWECPEIEPPQSELPVCPECPGTPDPSDGYPVIMSDDMDSSDYDDFIDVSQTIGDFGEIRGVTAADAVKMVQAGFYSRDDLRRASTDDLTEAMSPTRAERIKTIVGDVDDTHLIVADLTLTRDTDD